MIDPNQRITVLPNGQVHVETINEEPSMTQQQYKDECDINNIMKKYETTGEFMSKTQKQAIYGDFSEIKDYQGMLHQVMYAQEAFMQLPANVRSRFQNDPGQLLQFIQDDKNYEEALKLGIVNKREVTVATDTKNNDSNDTKNTKSTTQPS